MREIKFRYRIQDLKTKKVTILYKTLEQIEIGYMFDYCFNKKEEEIRKILSRDLYTGLKDKSGVDIYEGDKVKDQYRKKYVIIWREEFAGFEFMGDKTGTSWMPNYDEVIGNFLLIGNIYENNYFNIKNSDAFSELDL